MKVRDLLEHLAGVDLDAEVSITVHAPLSCCPDPDTNDRHTHDVPDVWCEVTAVDVWPASAVALTVVEVAT